MITRQLPFSAPAACLMRYLVGLFIFVSTSIAVDVHAVTPGTADVDVEELSEQFRSNQLELATFSLVRRSLSGGYRGRSFGSNLGRRMRAPATGGGINQLQRRKFLNGIRQSRLDFSNELISTPKVARSTLRRNLRIRSSRIRAQRIIPLRLRNHPIVKRAARAGFNPNGRANALVVPQKFYREASADRLSRVQKTLDGIWDSTKHKAIKNWQYARVLIDLNRREKAAIVASIRTKKAAINTKPIQNTRVPRTKRHCQNCTSQSRPPSVGGVNFMSDADGFFRNAKNRPDIDPNGYFDVITHGTSNRIQIRTSQGVRIVNHRTASRLIQQQPGYNGQTVRLLSCSTGRCKTGFAQNLSNKLGVTIEAPSDLLWAYPNGRMIIAPVGKNGFPDLSKEGRFRTFVPGGNIGN